MCRSRRGLRVGRPGLNGVRPRRPEQFYAERPLAETVAVVSMESGLEGRNNVAWQGVESLLRDAGLNGVRPRRPEQ